MIVNQYDRVLLKNGLHASVIEVFGDGYFLVDIDKEDDTYTEEIELSEIAKLL